MPLNINDIPNLFGMGPLLGDMAAPQVANAISSIIQGEEPDLNRAKLNIPIDQFAGFGATDPLLTSPMGPVPPPMMDNPAMMNIPQIPGFGATDTLLTSPDMTGIPMPSNPAMMNIPQIPMQGDAAGVDPILLNNPELINNLQALTGQGSSDSSMLNFPPVTNMIGSGFDETVVGPTMPVGPTTDPGKTYLSVSDVGGGGGANIINQGADISQIGSTEHIDTGWMKNYADIESLKRAWAIGDVTNEMAVAWLRNNNYGGYGATEAIGVLKSWKPTDGSDKNIPEQKPGATGGLPKALTFIEWHQQVYGTKEVPGGQTNITRGNEYKSYLTAFNATNMMTIGSGAKVGGGQIPVKGFVSGTGKTAGGATAGGGQIPVEGYVSGTDKIGGKVAKDLFGKDSGGKVVSGMPTMPSDIALTPGDAYSQYIRSFFPGAGTGELARLSKDPDKLYYGFNPNYGRYLLGLTDIPTVTEDEKIKGSLPMAGTFSDFLGRDYKQPLSAIRSKFGGLRDYLRAISPSGVGIEGVPSLGGFGTTYTTDPGRQDILSSAIASLGYAPGASSRAYSGLSSIFDAFKFKYSNPFEAQNRFADWVTKAYGTPETPFVSTGQEIKSGALDPRTRGSAMPEDQWRDTVYKDDSWEW